jgi:RNA recognition motif-containing protein
MHGSMRAADARSSLRDNLMGPAFLVRRSSENETLMLAKFGNFKAAKIAEKETSQPKHVRYEQPLSKSEASFGALTDSESEPDTEKKQSQTVIVLQNLPVELSRDMLVEALRAQGIAKFVDFVYRPFNFQQGFYHDWAYVNFSSAAAAENCFELLNGFIDWGIPSEEPCNVNWCTSFQGLDALIERYRDSQIMHEKMEDQYKPALFMDGHRISFPPPTKKLKVPRRNVCRQRHFR